MKKILIMMFVLGIMLISNNAYAIYYFDASGTVNQNYGNSWDSETGTGIARYTFGFEDTLVNVSEVALEFESDVFDVSKLVVTSVLPLGWANSVQAGSVTFVKDSGSAISASQAPIIFDVAYTLNDVEAYSRSSGDFGSWNEGQAWGQSYTLSGYRLPVESTLAVAQGNDGCGGEFALAGGSTNPVPEPMTMLLFGPALLGLVGLKKRKA